MVFLQDQKEVPYAANQGNPVPSIAPMGTKAKPTCFPAEKVRDKTAETPSCFFLFPGQNAQSLQQEGKCKDPENKGRSYGVPVAFREAGYSCCT